MSQPQWATAVRKEHLVKLFVKSHGFCVFRHPRCLYEDHHYVNYIEGCIDFWKSEDREERQFLLKLEQGRVIDGTFGRYGSDFDPVTRDVYYQNRPGYYFLAFGVAADSKKRIAVIRVPSTYMRLYVEVSDCFQGASNLSKNKRRKLARYGKAPSEVWERVDKTCAQAVRDYWASR